jgi:hypothetical protein
MGDINAMINITDSGFSYSPPIISKIFCLLLFALLFCGGIYEAFSAEKSYFIALILFVFCLSMFFISMSHIKVIFNDTQITVIKICFFPYSMVTMEIKNTEILIRKTIANAGTSSGTFYQIRFKDSERNVCVLEFTKLAKAEDCKNRIQNILNYKMNRM